MVIFQYSWQSGTATTNNCFCLPPWCTVNPSVSPEEIPGSELLCQWVCVYAFFLSMVRFYELTPLPVILILNGIVLLIVTNSKGKIWYFVLFQSVCFWLSGWWEAYFMLFVHMHRLFCEFFPYKFVSTFVTLWILTSVICVLDIFIHGVGICNS